VVITGEYRHPGPPIPWILNTTLSNPDLMDKRKGASGTFTPLGIFVNRASWQRCLRGRLSKVGLPVCWGCWCYRRLDDVILLVCCAVLVCLPTEGDWATQALSTAHWACEWERLTECRPAYRPTMTARMISLTTLCACVDCHSWRLVYTALCRTGHNILLRCLCVARWCSG